MKAKTSKPSKPRKPNVRARKPARKTAARKKPARKRLPKRMFLLYARPRGRNVPKWWPRDAEGQPAEVGVLDSGCGWVQGKGDPMDEYTCVFARELFSYEIKHPAFREVEVSDHA